MEDNFFNGLTDILRSANGLEESDDFLEGLNDIVHTTNDLAEIRREARVPRRVLRDAENPLEYFNEKDFKANLAFSKDGFVFVLEKFQDKIRRPFHDGLEISPMLRLTVYLQYIRSNNFYRSSSTQCFIKLPKTTIHNIVNAVAKDIASFSATYINFPDADEQETIAKYFFENYNFPGVIGIFGKCMF